MNDKPRSGEGVIFVSWLVIALLDLLSVGGALTYLDGDNHILTGELIGSIMFLLFGIASAKQSKDQPEKRMWVLFVLSILGFIFIRIPIQVLPTWGYLLCKVVTFVTACGVVFIKVMMRKS